MLDTQPISKGFFETAFGLFRRPEVIGKPTDLEPSENQIISPTAIQANVIDNRIQASPDNLNDIGLTVNKSGIERKPAGLNFWQIYKSIFIDDPVVYSVNLFRYRQLQLAAKKI